MYLYLRREGGRVRETHIEDILTQVLTPLVVHRAVWSVWEWDLLDDGVRISPRAAKEIGFPDDAEPDHMVAIPALPQTGLPIPCPVRFNVDSDLPAAVALVVDCKLPKEFPARCVVLYEGVPTDDVPDGLLDAFRDTTRNS